jgi:nucleotide-binding universal stress UspA family protein
MALYRRILVPLGQREDLAVLAHAAELAALCSAELVLLRVAHYHTRDSRTAELDESEALLEEAASRLAERKVALQRIVAHGEVAQTILAEAERLEVDLIVLASHGHGVLARAVLGCVGESLRRGSRIPVLLVRPSG